MRRSRLTGVELLASDSNRVREVVFFFAAVFLTTTFFFAAAFVTPAFVDIVFFPEARFYAPGPDATAAFTALLGKNFKTRLAGTLTGSPVAGFRAIRAARSRILNTPSGKRTTSPEIRDVSILVNI
jgi:hypothetical protein